MDPITLALLARSYMRRVRWEATVQANELARVLVVAMGGKVKGGGGGSSGSSNPSRRGEWVSADALRRMMESP